MSEGFLIKNIYNAYMKFICAEVQVSFCMYHSGGICVCVCVCVCVSVCVCVCVCVIVSLYGWDYLCVRWYSI